MRAKGRDVRATDPRYKSLRGVPAELKNKKKSAGLYSTLGIVCFVCQVYSSSFNGVLVVWE